MGFGGSRSSPPIWSPRASGPRAISRSSPPPRRTTSARRSAEARSGSVLFLDVGVRLAARRPFFRRQIGARPARLAHLTEGVARAVPACALVEHVAEPCAKERLRGAQR